MDKDRAIVGAPSLDRPSKLRVGLTYAAFAAGHIWAAVVSALCVVTMSSLLYDLVLAQSDAESSNILEPTLFFGGFYLVILVSIVWLLKIARDARSKKILNLSIALRPLFSAFLLIALYGLLQVFSSYRSWQFQRHASIGTVAYTCRAPNFEGNYVIPSTFRIKHIRASEARPERWLISDNGEDFIVGQRIEIKVLSFGENLGVRWTSTTGSEKVAVLNSTDRRGEYTIDEMSVDIGPAANVPLSWVTKEEQEQGWDWIEEGYLCQVDPKSWRPD